MAFGRAAPAVVRRLVGMPNDITLADAARDRGDWAEAVQLYAMVLARGPDRADLLVQLGNCAKEMGDYPRAAEAFRRARDIAPQNADATLMLAHLFKVTGNASAARAAYARAAEMGSADARQELLAAAGAADWVPRLPERHLASRTPQAIADALRLMQAEVAPQDPLAVADIADSLAAQGLADVAAAFRDLALLLAGPGRPLPPAPARAAFAGRPWPGPRSTGFPRALLRALVTASLADGPMPAAPVAALAFEASAAAGVVVDWTDAALAPAEQAALLETLRALRAAVEGAAGPDGTFAPDSAVCAGLGILAAAPRRCSFLGAGWHVADIEAMAWRVLHNLLQRLCHEIVDLLAAPALGPHMRGAIIRGAADIPPLHTGAAREAGALPPPDLAMLEGVLRTLLPETTPEPVLQTHLGRVVLGLACGTAPEVCHTLGWDIAGRGAVEAGVHLLTRHAPPDLLLDRGRMLELGQRLKQCGAWRAADSVLGTLRARYPEGDDILLELALVRKTLGDYASAVEAFQTLLRRRPDDEFLTNELLAIWPECASIETILPWVLASPRRTDLARRRLLYRRALGREPVDEPLLRMLPRRMISETSRLSVADPQPRLDVMQIGARRAGGEAMALLTGIEAVRVRAVGPQVPLAMRVRLGGRTVARVEAAEGAPLPDSRPEWQHAIFHAWIDVSGMPAGLTELQLHFEERDSGYQTREFEVRIGTEPDARERSNAFIPARVGGSVEDHVNGLETILRPARRGLIEGPVERVLVMRVDQLGDVSTSIPAMLRLRELFPQARFYGLASPFLRPLLDSLGLFEATESVAFLYDHALRTRHMPLSEAARLREVMRGWKIDVAVDLCSGADSRPLLLLADARTTIGFGPRDFPWLSFGIEAQSRDPLNGRECISHASMVMTLVEALGATLGNAHRTLPRTGDPGPARRRAGLPADGRFAVLHAGSRLPVTRWPMESFAALARMIATQAGLHVLLIADGPLPEAVRADLQAMGERVVLAEGQLAFDDFDMLASSCAVFVGNDSGPKHLAALRGAPVVSVHMGRHNWDEWGQDGHGYIVSRRVPCVGCGVEEAADCGKGLPCLVHIRPEDIFAAVRACLEEQGRTDARAVAAD